MPIGEQDARGQPALLDEAEPLVEAQRAQVARTRDQLDPEDGRLDRSCTLEEGGEERRADVCALEVRMDGDGEVAEDVRELARTGLDGVDLAREATVEEGAQRDAGAGGSVEKAFDVGRVHFVGRARETGIGHRRRSQVEIEHGHGVCDAQLLNDQSDQSDQFALHVVNHASTLIGRTVGGAARSAPPDHQWSSCALA